MSRGHYLSKHQQGIVRRHYQNYDTKALEALASLVSDLAVETDQKKADKLWARAGEWLAKAGVPAAKLAPVVDGRKLAALAQLVGDVGKGAFARPDTDARPSGRSHDAGADL